MYAKSSARSVRLITVRLSLSQSFFRTYDVFIPKFSIKTSYSLNPVLTEMGMTDMFGDRADLSGIAEGIKLAVSEVGVEYVIAQNFLSQYSVYYMSCHHPLGCTPS